MIIRSATFITSSAKFSQLPPPDLPEYAFIGRSNVGKSSLLNMLVARKGLAKISGSPGKTQTINHFLINEGWYLVDLPGYGYARRSQKMRAEWDRLFTIVYHHT
ncbi:MAG: ribosome biogenesis GTP-binding protein YihA/YsxC [Marinilabiliales bacterium]|nr:ribosome biogenesis GTP-binding protein YihA/YsxC [Marinilabiliales bacterium]